jgi:hypothetical protein
VGASKAQRISKGPVKGEPIVKNPAELAVEAVKVSRDVVLYILNGYDCFS